ncbi:MAG: sulfite exporter TauE/SafE family protein [Dehalococcoidia bacterium]
MVTGGANLENNKGECLLSGLELLIALAAVLVGATIMGTVSFGMGLVVTPILLLFLAPQSAVVVVNGIILILLSAVLFNTRRHFDLSLMWKLGAGGVIAAPIGVLALSSANPTLLRITIAVAILFLGILSLFDVQIPLAKRKSAGFYFGFLTSLSVSALSIGGPLAVIYVIAQNWPREVMRVALAYFFVSSYAVAFVVYAAVGLTDRDTLINIGLLVPALAVGFGLATRLVRRINESVFRYVAIAVIITGSVALLVREFAL